MNNNWKGPTMSLWLSCVLLLFPALSQAQQITAKVNDVKNWVVSIAQVVFVIIMVIGVIKVVKEFISGSPKAWTFLVYLIIAAMLYFGLSTIITDMSSLGSINNING